MKHSVQRTGHDRPRPRQRRRGSDFGDSAFKGAVAGLIGGAA